jgi:(E)-4-hydroxy-3-methylbut-2-enyl-diphosphate synthase
VELAEEVKRTTKYAADQKITIAVMGCRVNGPGETDSADLGLWCGPRLVTLKRGSQKIGSWPFDEVIEHLHVQLREMIAAKSCPPAMQGGESVA